MHRPPQSLKQQPLTHKSIKKMKLLKELFSYSVMSLNIIATLLNVSYSCSTRINLPTRTHWAIRHQLVLSETRSYRGFLAELTERCPSLKRLFRYRRAPRILSCTIVSTEWQMCWFRKWSQIFCVTKDGANLCSAPLPTSNQLSNSKDTHTHTQRAALLNKMFIITSIISVYKNV